MAKYETWEILQMMEEEDVKFIRMQFVDIFGTIRNIACLLYTSPSPRD